MAILRLAAAVIALEALLALVTWVAGAIAGGVAYAMVGLLA